MMCSAGAQSSRLFPVIKTIFSVSERIRSSAIQESFDRDDGLPPMGEKTCGALALHRRRSAVKHITLVLKVNLQMTVSSNSFESIRRRAAFSRKWHSCCSCEKVRRGTSTIMRRIVFYAGPGWRWRARPAIDGRNILIFIGVRGASSRSI
jgi:hypothetical protein